MSVFRINKTGNYTVMSNYHFKDKSLSLKAKGLLSQMLSLPNDWDYTISGLCAINKENEAAIKSALRELQQFGYLKITKKMPNETASGRIEYIYDIYECPIQEVKKQGVENLQVEIQGVENQGQLNINKSNTKKLNTNNKYLSEFENLWKEYPRKQGKSQAFKAYVKARSTGAEFAQVQEGVKAYAEYVKNTEQRYIKQGSTWFSGQCWDDEYEETKEIRKNNASYDIDELEKIK